MIKGFTCGTFDLLHAGHTTMLGDCKEKCDALIVGLQVDPSVDRPEKSKPIQSVLERTIQLLDCRYVDQVMVYETEEDLKNLLGVLDVDIRFIGEDWDPRKITGRKICDKRKIEICFTERNHNWSTTNLRERIKNGNKKR